MDYTHKRIIVFDTETTGLKAGVDNIIEIAAVELLEGNLTGNQFHAYLAARKKITFSATSVHKMNNHFYDKYYGGMYKSNKAVVQGFLAFVGDSELYAHNVPFDKRFLDAECKYWGIPCIPKSRFKCTMRLFYNTVSPVHRNLKLKNSLRDCCTFFKLNVNSNQFHGALYDATMAAKMLKNVFEYNNSTLNLNYRKALKERLLMSKSEFKEFKESNLGYEEYLSRKREREELNEEAGAEPGSFGEPLFEIIELNKEVKQGESRQLGSTLENRPTQDQMPAEPVFKEEQTISLSLEAPQKAMEVLEEALITAKEDY